MVERVAALHKMDLKERKDSEGLYTVKELGWRNPGRK